MNPLDREQSCPRGTCKVRCCNCGQVFFDDLLHLSAEADDWCCKDYPTCKGMGADIVIAEAGHRLVYSDWQSRYSDFDPSDPYKPPEVPERVQCLRCGQFFMSDEMQRNGDKWGCKFWPECDGYGFGLHIFKANDSRFRD